MSSNEFRPRYSFINSISNAQNALVSFTGDHDFIIGEIVSFRVEKAFGMFQINKKRGKVLSIPNTNQIIVDVDTLTWTPFDYSLIDTAGTTPPVCVSSSSGVIPNQIIPQTSIQDAFDNVPI